MKMRFLATPLVLAASVLAISGCGSSSSSSDTTNTTSTTSTTATIDAKALFMEGKASTGAQACAACHKLAAAGSTAATIGPNLDEIAPEDKAEALGEMITDPNGEIVAGFKKDIMPQDYAKTLTTEEVAALAKYIDDNSAHAEK